MCIRDSFIVAALIGNMVRKPVTLIIWKPVFCMKLSLRKMCIRDSTNAVKERDAMTQPKTDLAYLRSEKAKAEQQLRYYQHREKILEHQIPELTRKARVHRLCTRAGMPVSYTHLDVYKRQMQDSAVG